MNNAYLVLKDGTVMRGASFGAQARAAGEVVFNTAMSGYEEMLTDPSYHRQIVVMTAPEMGNYGITLEDEESFGGPKVAGFVVREHNASSNHRSKLDLGEYLVRHGIVAICGVDTRQLTIHLRDHGAQPGLIAVGEPNLDQVKKDAAALKGMAGQNLAAEVTTPQAYTVGRKDARYRIALLDFGVKQNIAFLLATRDCQVTVLPCTSSAADVAACNPHGILLSNGPGDPSVMTQETGLVKSLIGQYPMFGICLGHQLLGLALGAKTFKLKFGHRGANQPVLDVRTKKILITSQNHGFCIDPSTLPAGCELTHLNLSDDTCEGFSAPGKALFAVQFHPEASPGPHDAAPLFDDFVRMLPRLG